MPILHPYAAFGSFLRKATSCGVEASGDSREEGSRQHVFLSKPNKDGKALLHITSFLVRGTPLGSGVGSGQLVVARKLLLLLDANTQKGLDFTVPRCFREI